MTKWFAEIFGEELQAYRRVWRPPLGKPTNSIEESHSWEAHSYSSIQEITDPLRNTKVRYNFHKTAPLSAIWGRWMQSTPWQSFQDEIISNKSVSWSDIFQNNMGKLIIQKNRPFSYFFQHLIPLLFFSPSSLVSFPSTFFFIFSLYLTFLLFYSPPTLMPWIIHLRVLVQKISYFSLR
jgi:hypothetical protein